MRSPGQALRIPKRQLAEGQPMENEAASRDQAELDCGELWTVMTVQCSPQSREARKG